MSLTYIECGFQSIVLDFFREKSISKGKKLFESHHVTNVQETINSDGERVVSGKVIPQTRVHDSPYDVKIKLNGDRTISTTHCSCKAGLSVRGCKHIAAVCIFMNNENTESRTDRPQVWNQPRKSQVEKYKKGCTIQNLFPSDKHVIDCDRTCKIDDVENISNTMTDINCLLSRYLKSEKEVEPQRKIAMEEEERRKTAARLVVQQIYELQKSSTVYNSYEVHSIGDLKMRLKKFTCPDSLREKYEKIVVTENDCLEICIRSISQSNCFEWFQERVKRITSSSKAHRIKTRTDKFDNLAVQFKNEKFEGKINEAMKYGIEMECVARNCFSAQTGLQVDSVGLVINVRQPFLATSPDGVITSEDTLLEIKCPFSCKDKDIINRDEKFSNVPYLEIDDENNLFLKKNHPYYTQVQVSMYILNMKMCHFFVFSAKDNVHISVVKDDDFLRELIPKIEWFYFTYFLPLLF